MMMMMMSMGMDYYSDDHPVEVMNYLTMSTNTTTHGHEYGGVWSSFVITATTAAVAIITIIISSLLIKSYFSNSPLIHPPPHHHQQRLSLPHNKTCSDDEPQQHHHHHHLYYYSTTSSLFTFENRKSGKFSLKYYGAGRQDHDDDIITVTKPQQRLRQQHWNDIAVATTIGMSKSKSSRSTTVAIDSPSSPKSSYNYRPLEEEEAIINTNGINGWELGGGVLKLKTREMNWYRYQDLSVLQGNVVQLYVRTSYQ